jgi:hypothetical protein
LFQAVQLASPSSSSKLQTVHFRPTNCPPFHRRSDAEIAKRTNQLLCVKFELFMKIPVFRDAVIEALKE